VGHGAYSLTSRCARQPKRATPWPTPHSSITCLTDKSTHRRRASFRIPLLRACGSVVEFCLPLMTSTRRRTRMHDGLDLRRTPGTGPGPEQAVADPSGVWTATDLGPTTAGPETETPQHGTTARRIHDTTRGPGAREDKARMFTPTTCRRLTPAADHVPARGRTHHLSAWTEKAITAQVVTSDYFTVKSGLTCTPTPDLAHGEVRGGSPTMTPAAAPAAPRHDLASVRPLSAPTRGGAALPYNTMKTGE
jgi:hypothetical protein